MCIRDSPCPAAGTLPPAAGDRRAVFQLGLGAGRHLARTVDTAGQLGRPAQTDLGVRPAADVEGGVVGVFKAVFGLKDAARPGLPLLQQDEDLHVGGVLVPGDLAQIELLPLADPDVDVPVPGDRQRRGGGAPLELVPLLAAPEGGAPGPGGEGLHPLVREGDWGEGGGDLLVDRLPVCLLYTSRCV